MQFKFDDPEQIKVRIAQVERNKEWFERKRQQNLTEDGKSFLDPALAVRIEAVLTSLDLELTELREQLQSKSRTPVQKVRDAAVRMIGGK